MSPFPLPMVVRRGGKVFLCTWAILCGEKGGSILCGSDGDGATKVLVHTKRQIVSVGEH
jgi:hypothetical protein